MSRQSLSHFLRYSILIALLLTSFSAIVIPTINWWGPRIGNWLTTPPDLTSSDAIIVLGGNTMYRIRTAIGLYQNDLNPLVAITGATSESNERNEAVAARDAAIVQGIPAENIYLLETSSTFEDAKAIVAFVDAHSLTDITIVSDWTHARRSVCTIEQGLSGRGTTVRFVSAASMFGPQNWWLSEDNVFQVASEIGKLAYYALVHKVPYWNCFAGDGDFVKTTAVLLTGFFCSLIAIGIVHRWAIRNLLDMPNERSLHQIPVPRGGGFGVALVTLVLLTVFAAKNFASEIATYIAISSIVALTGWMDDRHRLSPKLRLIVHTFLSLFLVVSVGPITMFSLPLFGEVTLATFVGIVVTVFWIVTLLNEFNFMDGIDGMAGTQALVASSVWCLLLIIEGEHALALLAGLIAVTSLAFLCFNAAPARIFLGDVGSTFLGFTLAVLPVLAFQQSNNSRLLVTGAMVVAPTTFDATYTLVRRLFRRENVLQAHRTHLYQRLVIIGYSHATVTGLYSALAWLSGLLAILYYALPSPFYDTPVLILIVVLTCLPITIWWLERIKQPSAKNRITAETSNNTPFSRNQYTATRTESSENS